jgi:hypothetical protein
VDDLGWFWGGGSGHDRTLRRNVDSIEDAVVPHSSDPSPSIGRASPRQGSTEHRLALLSAQVADLTELVDLRAQMAAYLPATMLRWAARRRIAALVGGAGLPFGVDDVAGYWLAPGLDALGYLAAGSDGGHAVAEARRRDTVRTSMFLGLSLAVTGRSDQVWPFLRHLLPPEAAADGSGTAVSAAAASEADGSRADGSAAAAAASEADGSASAPAEADGSVDGSAPAEEVADPAVDRPLTAARLTYAARLGWIATADGQLGAAVAAELPAALGALLGSPERDDGLAQWVAAAGTIPQPRRSNDWAEVPLRAAARLTVLDGWCADVELEVAAPAPIAPPGPGPARAVVDLLRFVIEEGSPPEMALLARDRRLSDAIRGRDHVPPVRLEEVIGTVSEFLAADAFGPKPTLRSLALRAAAPWVIHAADALRREAHLPPSSYLSLQIGRTTFKVTATGVEPEELAAAVQAAIGPEPTSLNPLTRHRENVARDAYAVETRARYESAIAKAVQSLVEWHATCATAAEEADRLFASIKRRLGGTPADVEIPDGSADPPADAAGTDSEQAEEGEAVSGDAGWGTAASGDAALSGGAATGEAASTDDGSGHAAITGVAVAGDDSSGEAADGQAVPAATGSPESADMVVPVAVAPVVVAAPADGDIESTTEGRDAPADLEVTVPDGGGEEPE